MCVPYSLTLHLLASNVLCPNAAENRESCSVLQSACFWMEAAMFFLDKLARISPAEISFLICIIFKAEGVAVVMADGTEPRNALWRRDEQLTRWNLSETNKESSEPRDSSKAKIQFQDGCVFLAACSSSDTDEVEKLLKKGADINTANIDGLTALHQVRFLSSSIFWNFSPFSESCPTFTPPGCSATEKVIKVSMHHFRSRGSQLEVSKWLLTLFSLFFDSNFLLLMSLNCPCPKWMTEGSAESWPWFV